LYAGLLLPASDLGAVGTASGKMQTASILGGSLDFGNPAKRLGARLSGAVALRSGIRFEPTPICQRFCDPWIDRLTRNRAFAVDITWRAKLPGTDLDLAAGSGFRDYHRQDVDCTCDESPAGDFLPFAVDEFRLIYHLAIGLSVRTTGPRVRFQLEDYWGSFQRTRQRQHDLLLSIGLRL
jgi:hypothetical protein